MLLFICSTLNFNRPVNYMILIKNFESAWSNYGEIVKKKKKTRQECSSVGEPRARCSFDSWCWEEEIYGENYIDLALNFLGVNAMCCLPRECWGHISHFLSCHQEAKHEKINTNLSPWVWRCKESQYQAMDTINLKSLDAVGQNENFLPTF